jgi:general secretion pathway protein I
MRFERGFTLLEILVALAIAVVGISAIVKSAAGAIDTLQSSEDRILGSWVAGNRLAELRLSRIWPAAATRDLSEKYAGRDWYYREKISTTSDPDLLRVDLTVYTDSEHEHFGARLFGYISRYVPPTIAPAQGSQGAPVPDQSDSQRQSSAGDGSDDDGGQTGNTEESQRADQGNLRDPGIFDPAQLSNQL